MHISPTERDAAKLADWMELETLYSGENSLSFEVLRAQIAIVYLQKGWEPFASTPEPHLSPDQYRESAWIIWLKLQKEKS